MTDNLLELIEESGTRIIEIEGILNPIRRTPFEIALLKESVRLHKALIVLAQEIGVLQQQHLQHHGRLGG